MDCSVVLCADPTSIRYPETLGLEGENFSAQTWLKAFSSACEARHYIQQHAVDKVWVADCEDVDPVNSAAAFKKDVGNGEVLLIADKPSCSLQSRALRASIDAVVTTDEFALCYGREKRRRRRTRSAPEQQHASRTSKPSVLQVPDLGLGGYSAAGNTERTEPPKHPEHPEHLERAGCAGLAKPAEPAEPGRVLSITPPTARQRAFVLPVISGSGGSGKSTVAALSALLARERGYRTLLIDLDMQFGDLASMLGAGECLYLDDAIDYPDRLSQLKMPAGMPAFIAAPRRFERAEELAASLPRLLDAVEGDFDLIVANTGGFWAEQHAVMLERSSRALFLVDQRPSSLQACRRAIELCERCNIATSSLLFVANRCSKNALYSSIDISCSLRGAPAVELRDGGSEVEELVYSGHSADLLVLRNELCVSLDRVLSEILPKRESIKDREDASPSIQRRARRPLRSARRREAACLG